MFKVPSTIPQDLLLIHDLVSEPTDVSSDPKAHPVLDAASRKRSESIGSSGSSSDSDSDSEEVNIVESLLVEDGTVATDGEVGIRSPSPSSSESSSDDSDSKSDSSSDSDVPVKARGKSLHEDVDEDDEDEGPRTAVGSVLRTKNELPEPSIVLPDITEIDAQESLEKVGEIMNIIGNVVIVKGVSSQIESKASERALDSESLLVFEDRKVLGYVHETFGPTYQPLYQVKFLSSEAIDKDSMTIGREVFHVPHRSHFVFPSQLQKMKGSDASNVHDEEIGVDEMEFSDDEAEAAFRQQRKRRREANRESSAVSSRFSTPTPSQQHDQELNASSFYGASPYDEYGPYDVDVAPRRPRPAPLPYDDPYADGPSLQPSGDTSLQVGGDRRDPLKSPRTFEHGHSQDRGRRGRGRGRGRGQGREYDGRGGTTSMARRGRRPSFTRNSSSTSNDSRSLSPTSMVIARATGQFTDSSAFVGNQAPLSPSASASTSSYWQQQESAYGQFNSPSMQSYGVQPTRYSQHQAYSAPHINPRFASMFGINMNYTPDQQYSPYVASNSSTASPYSSHTPNTPWSAGNWPQCDMNGNGTQFPSANEYTQMKSDQEEYSS